MASLKKVCKRCSKERDLSDYCVHRQTKDGLQPVCNPCNAVRQKEVRRENPTRHMLHAAKHRAKRDNLPFDITQDDIEIPEVCPVLGIPIFMGEGKHCKNSPSLDKIIPSRGYVKDNIIVVSHRANALKRDATIDELQLLVDFYGSS